MKTFLVLRSKIGPLVLIMLALNQFCNCLNHSPFSFKIWVPLSRFQVGIKLDADAFLTISSGVFLCSQNKTKKSKHLPIAKRPGQSAIFSTG